MNAARHGRDRIRAAAGGEQPLLDQLWQRLMQRDIAAGDRGGARAAIGLQHVAIDRDLALAQRGEIGDGAQDAADQALDFLGAARLLAARRLAVGAGMGRARQHAVFRRDPAAPGVAQERRHLVPRRWRCTAHGCRRIARGTSLRHIWQSPARAMTARSSSAARPDGRGMAFSSLNCGEPETRPMRWSAVDRTKARQR